MNKLLEGQLAKYFNGNLPGDLAQLFNEISNTYDHYEKKHKILERTAEISENELSALNARLLKESNELTIVNSRLKNLFESIDSAFFSIDFNTNYLLQVSPGWKKIYGSDTSDFYGNPNLWKEVIVEDDKHVLDEYEACVLKGQLFACEYRIISADGKTRWVETKLTPTFDGKNLRIDGFTTDISIRKEITKKIEESETRFRRLIENSYDGIALLDKNRKLMYVSNSVKRILGYTSADMGNNNLFDYIHAEDAENVSAILDSISKKAGSTTELVCRTKNKDGEWRWINSYVTNMLHENGIGAIVFNFKDISLKVEMQTALEFDRKNRDALINSTKDLMWSIDDRMCLVTANDSFINAVKSSGGVSVKPGDHLLNHNFFPPRVVDKWKKRYEKVLKGKAFTVEEYSASPVEAWAEISFNPMIENGRIIGASCFSHDITEKKKVSEYVLKSEQMMAEAQRISHMGSWECRFNKAEKVDNNSMQWSDEIFRIHGYNPGQLKVSYKNFFNLVHHEDLNCVKLTLQDAFRYKKSCVMEYRIIRPDKVERWIRTTADMICDLQTGKLTKMIGTAHDITERKQLEEERQKITNDLIQRNKDLEQFAYIISHNLRAPVANILGLSSLIEKKNLAKEVKEECFKGLTKSTRLLDQIIMDLNHILQVKRQISERKTQIKFRTIVHNITQSIAGIIEKEQVIINTDFSEVSEIYTVKDYLYSIFYNLISNSIKYRQHGVKPVISISTKKSDDNHVFITFKDNSQGIDMEKYGDKVFGLYKRFHLDVEGKGIGLFMVKTQVESLGGNISIASEVNKGTEITIKLLKNVIQYKEHNVTNTTHYNHR